MDNPIVWRGLERLMIEFGGVAFGVLGYLLYKTGVTAGKSHLQAKTKIGHFVISGWGPGLIFMVLGAIILVTGLYTGKAESMKSRSEINEIMKIDPQEKNDLLHRLESRLKGRVSSVVDSELQSWRKEHEIQLNEIRKRSNSIIETEVLRLETNLNSKLQNIENKSKRAITEQNEARREFERDIDHKLRIYSTKEYEADLYGIIERLRYQLKHLNDRIANLENQHKSKIRWSKQKNLSDIKSSVVE